MTNTGMPFPAVAAVFLTFLIFAVVTIARNVADECKRDTALALLLYGVIYLELWAIIAILAGWW